MNGPLAGVKVVELAIWVAGPSAGALLSDWGAEVIKIEDPRGGDPMRTLAVRSAFAVNTRIPAAFMHDNRNKRSIAINLHHAEGRELALKLLERADVFVTNLRIDALERLHLDYETLSQHNPRLIYASMTGYGARGPDRHRGGFDFAAAWARTGMMASMTEPGHPPPEPRAGMFDHAAGLGLAGAISAALFARERSGRGQEVRSSLFATGLWMNSVDLAVALTTGRTPKPRARIERPNPLANMYCCADGKWLYLVMPQSDRYWNDFCDALEQPEWIQDARFASPGQRARHSQVLTEAIDSVIRRRTLDQWTPVFDRLDFVWAPVQSPAEVLTDPQARALEIFKKLDHPQVPHLRVIAGPAEFGLGAPGPRAVSPELGQHTEEIALEAGLNREAIARLKAEGALG